MKRGKIREPKDRGSKHIPGKVTELREEDSDDKLPLFSFKHCCRQRYQLHEWHRDELKSLISSLRKMSQIPWKDVHRDKGLHYEAGVDLDKTTRRALPESVPKDCPIDSFRVSLKGRVWGYRAEHVFYIIWFDRNHDVCPEGKQRGR